jgi:hypothetical protein
MADAPSVATPINWLQNEHNTPVTFLVATSRVDTSKQNFRINDWFNCAGFRDIVFVVGGSAVCVQVFGFV